jgi:hypothetical protein
MLHAILGPILGFFDDGQPPTSNNSLPEIPVSALRKGFEIFGEDLNTDCLQDDEGSQVATCSATRSPGFVDLAGINYDQSSRQHSFIGSFTHYIQNSYNFRTLINQDVTTNANVMTYYRESTTGSGNTFSEGLNSTMTMLLCDRLFGPMKT